MKHMQVINAGAAQKPRSKTIGTKQRNLSLFATNVKTAAGQSLFVFTLSTSALRSGKCT